MRSTFYLFQLLLLLFPPALSAQTQQGFDPVVYLSTVKIHQYYGQGNIRIPEDMNSAMVDSVVSNNMTLGFSVLLSSDSAGTWKMWLDFDADRYYRPRLTRIFAQRPVGKDEYAPFAELRQWVEAVQKSNLGNVAHESEELVSWPWLRRTGYVLTIRSVDSETGAWLTLDLSR